MTTENTKTLADYGLTVEFDIPADCKKDGTWQCVAWRCRFTQLNTTSLMRSIVEFTYYTGTGIYKNARVARRSSPPNPLEILHAIALDAQAINMTFEEWASDFGYDSDSRKAEAIYKECIASGKKLQSILTPAQIEEIANLEF